MANEILGAKSYLMLASEDIWGSNPMGAAGSGSNASGSAQDYMHIPCNEYSVRFHPDNRQHTPFIGLKQRKHSTNYRGMPSGQLIVPFYGWKADNMSTSVAEYLMQWGFANHETDAPPSKTAAWAEGPNISNKIHNGLRVSTATLAGDDDSGEVTITLELQGKTEDTLSTMPALPVDHEKLVEAKFADVSLTLGGTAVNIKQFQWQVQSVLIAEYLNSFNPSLLLKTAHIETFQCTLIKNASTYDVYRRLTTDTELAATLVVKGLHNGTGGSGNYSQVSVSLPRMHFIDSDDQVSLDSLVRQPLSFVVLKPDNSNNCSAMTWSEV